MVRKAICCCGACSIEVEGEPTLNGVCHCENCRRRTGSAFGWQAYFLDAQVIATRGDFHQFPIRDEQQRWFCAHCGTTLYWKSAFMPGQTGIAAGAFVDPELPEPTVEATSHKRLEWLGFPKPLAHLS